MSRAGKGRHTWHRSDAGQKAQVEALRKIGCLVWHIGRPADLLVYRDDYGLKLLESKRRKGALTPAQRKAREAGWPIIVAEDVESALAEFGVYYANPYKAV